MANVEHRLLGLLFSGVLAVALIMLGYDIITPDVGYASESTITTLSYQGPPANHQTGGATSSPQSDQRVPVQVWTVMAAGGAAAIGLLLFFVRIALGRVAPPPPQEDAHH